MEYLPDEEEMSWEAVNQQGGRAKRSRPGQDDDDEQPATKTH